MSDSPRTRAVEIDRVSVRDVTVQYGDVRALDGVSVDFRSGEVHAVLGENGAGKSTLMNVLAGLTSPNDGSVFIDGKPVSFRNPKDAIDHKIGMVHQRVRLIRKFTVADNLLLGDPSCPRIVRRKEYVKKLEAEAKRFGIAIDPLRVASDLSLGEKQRVEILRALMRGVNTLILDEPTTALSAQEVSTLFDSLRKLVESGLTVIFISHKLREVLAIADRVTILRRGTFVGTLDRSECDTESLSALVMGPNASTGACSREGKDDQPRKRGRNVMSLQKGTALGGQGHGGITDLSFSLAEGEVIGVAGVAGNGQHELAEVLTGIRSLDAGAITRGEVDLTKKTRREYIRAGIAYIPEDRWNEGLIGEEPIWRNTLFHAYRTPPVGKGPLLSRRNAHEFSERMCEEVSLTTQDVQTLVSQLSGGNAQRLLTQREVQTKPDIIVAVNATQGLDVGAAAWVQEILLKARGEGSAIVYISADLDELMDLSDRIIVLCDGEIVQTFQRPEFSRESIGTAMGGVKVNPKTVNSPGEV